METRRSKRLRRTVTIDTAPFDKPGSINLLTTLPTDVLCHTVRWLSARPQHSRWMSYIEPYDLLCLLESSGPLVCAAQSVLTSLCVIPKREWEREVMFSHDGGALSHGTVLVDPDLEHLLLPPLLRLLAPRLRTLDVCHEFGWDAQAKAGCRALQSLTLRGTAAVDCAPGVLYVVGAQLVELRLFDANVLSKEVVCAIASTCTKLRRISIEAAALEAPLRTIWQNLGATLEKLALSHPHDSFYGSKVQYLSIDALVKHCTSLTDFELLQCDECDVSPLWVSRIGALGASLRVLRFQVLWTCPKPHILAVLREKCPHAVFDVFVNRDLCATLRVLGSRLRTLGVDDGAVSREQVRDTAVQCGRVERLRLSATARFEQFLSDFLSSPKPLRDIYLDCSYSQIRQAKNFLDKVADATGKVERFSLATYRPVSGPALRGIVRANPCLRHFFLECQFKTQSSPKNSENAAVSVIHELKHCERLSQLVIGDVNIKERSTLVAEACRQLPHRTCDILVGKHSYLR